MLKSIKQRGDTLIEVLIAVAIFSAVAVGAITIMNQGVSAAQGSLEMNLVRNQIDSQAELLRYFHEVYMADAGGSASADAAKWSQIVSLAEDEASDYDNVRTFKDCKKKTPGFSAGMPSHSFYIDPNTKNIVTSRSKFHRPTTFAQIYPGSSGASEMIWIEAVYDENEQDDDGLDQTQYYDFHIRACWDSPAPGAGLMKLGTIVRLYAPKN